MLRDASSGEADAPDGSRRKGALILAAVVVVLVLVLVLAGGIGYVWQARVPIRLGQYLLTGPKCTEGLTFSAPPGPGTPFRAWVQTQGNAVMYFEWNASFAPPTAGAWFNYKPRTLPGRPGIGLQSGRVLWHWGGFSLLRL